MRAGLIKIGCSTNPRGADHREPEMAEVQSLIARVRQSLEAVK
jgi:hypothetical protein